MTKNVKYSLSNHFHLNNFPARFIDGEIEEFGRKGEKHRNGL